MNEIKEWLSTVASRGGIVGIFLFVCTSGIGARGADSDTIWYGITPYQDSDLPVVAAKLGWYKEQGLNVQLVPLEWGDVPVLCQVEP